jgi:hypothetical protein
MKDMDTLRLAAALAFAVSVAALVWQARRASSLGPSRVEAPARGVSWDGVVYAFGRGMSPWAKDSARQHLAVYVAGVVYHLGVFASLGLVLLAVVGAPWLDRIAWIAAPLLGCSLIAGATLLVRRVGARRLRALSSPDDFASNVLVTLLVASALVSVAGGGYAPSLLVTATLVFLYAPLGKIRHCVFFFLARAQFGRLMGRRGVLPGGVHGARL